MRRRAAPRWLFGVTSLALTTVLVAATRERAPHLDALEYARWVDGKVYSMASWRFWDDMYVAVSRYLDWTDGPKRRAGDPDQQIEAFRALLREKADHREIRPTEFWRTIPEAGFLKVRKKTFIPPLEDPGRPLLLAAAFVLLRGIAPYLLIWLGTLAAIPALLWVLWEARAAGVFTAGTLFAALCVSSPFVVESLSLSHSAVGFYLIGALIVVALALYGFLGPDRSVRGFAVRATLASLAFAVCCMCRASTLPLALGLGIALSAATRRVFPRLRGLGLFRETLLAGLFTVAALVPYYVLRPPQYHVAWMGVWQGLGDYGTDRGYSWHDRDLKRWLAANGRQPFDHPRYVTANDEDFMRGVVLRDIRSDPAWFARILGRRLVDTVSLAKLAPWGPRDGISILPPPLHYKYTTPADWFGFGERAFEVPTAALWIGTLAFFAAWAIAAARSRTAAKSRLEAFAAPVLTLAAATLPMPVLLTTAGAMETETFVLVHFLALALVLQRAFEARTGYDGDLAESTAETGAPAPLMGDR